MFVRPTNQISHRLARMAFISACVAALIVAAAGPLHRYLGLDIEAAIAFALEHGATRIVLMSHFARADELDSPASNEQVAVFEAARQGLSAEISLRNSPAVLGWPQVPSDWVRPGIMLYGATPFEVPQAQAQRLQPVMTLESKVICVRELPAGEPVGYGARFVSERPTRVGVVAMGYADGYPRQAPNGTPVMVAGKRTQLIGRVSMDMLCIDLTDVPEATVGSPVELWGKQVLASEVAAHAGTIPYQIFCNLKRVPKDYCGE